MPQSLADTSDPVNVNRRILIAEDSEDNRFLLEAYLKSAPYDITFVENGQLAVENTLSRTFDLILMDMQMPIMDGLTATRMIRQAERESGRSGRSAIPVIALTANSRKEDMQACKEAGCTAHLTKPIAKPKLVSAIEEYFGRRVGIRRSPLCDTLFTLIGNN